MQRRAVSLRQLSFLLTVHAVELIVFLSLHITRFIGVYIVHRQVTVKPCISNLLQSSRLAAAWQLQAGNCSLAANSSCLFICTWSRSRTSIACFIAWLVAEPSCWLAQYWASHSIHLYWRHSLQQQQQQQPAQTAYRSFSRSQHVYMNDWPFTTCQPVQAASEMDRWIDQRVSMSCHQMNSKKGNWANCHRNRKDKKWL